MDILTIFAIGMSGAIFGVVIVVAFWQILKEVFPALKKRDLI